MDTVTLEALTKAKYADPAGTFTKVALAGGFGNIHPSHGGGLAVGSIVDPEAKKAVAAILADKGGEEDKNEPDNGGKKDKNEPAK